MGKKEEKNGLNCVEPSLETDIDDVGRVINGRPSGRQRRNTTASFIPRRRGDVSMATPRINTTQAPITTDWFYSFIFRPTSSPPDSTSFYLDFTSQRSLWFLIARSIHRKKDKCRRSGPAINVQRLGYHRYGRFGFFPSS